MSAFAYSDIPDQSGKTAIVTGANTGLGYCIAEALARSKAKVLLACRSEDKAREAMDRIAEAVLGADTEFLELDLQDMDSIRGAAKAAQSQARLDILVNNAGIMVPPLKLAMGVESQFATNHLGHFALTGLLLDKLAQNGGARIVNQSSIAHRGAKIGFDNLDGAKGYSRQRFYGQSKLANLLFTFELDRRLRAAQSPVSAYAAHPGIAETELMRHLGPLALMGKVVGVFLNSAKDGALPALQAATWPDAEPGGYYGPYGLGEISGPRSGRAIASRTARDPLLAARLWEISVELTGVDPGLPADDVEQDI
ncbi:oxidoreductase [Erythrobacter litoralis]|uniref:Putative oxidoreductase protein n=1 Tax=Erythrobacter litoralis (strain HTCC2594) TaxID=314225 RepID=Q2NCP4_ERYLH|nr:oxidoreductase [Erythrobacter litoralis]ABC62547.1 putative oxidoreductase protein [Erythrobacter litoralis HTCC2594]